MTPHLTSPAPRPAARLAARVTLIAAASLALLAGSLGAGAATAAPAPGGDAPVTNPPALAPQASEATVTSVGCSAQQAGFSAATGSCTNPSPQVDFRVWGTCQHAVTRELYTVLSPIVPSSQTVSVFCSASAFTDPILDWGVHVFGEPDLPEIHSLTCQIVNWNQVSCQTSASHWTSLSWRLDGKHLIRWNNHTSMTNNCNGGLNSDPTIEIEVRPVSVRVTASNAHGTTHKTISTADCVIAGS